MEQHSVFSPRTNLVPIRRPCRDERLGWFGRELSQKTLMSGWMRHALSPLSALDASIEARHATKSALEYLLEVEYVLYLEWHWLTPPFISKIVWPHRVFCNRSISCENAIYSRSTTQSLRNYSSSALQQGTLKTSHIEISLCGLCFERCSNACVLYEYIFASV